MVDYAVRPDQLDGCWQTWSEQDVNPTVRSQMETGAPKVRLRFTGFHRVASVSVTLQKELYEFFLDWYRINCQSGVLPTVLKEPDGTEAVWRFIEPPIIEWVGMGAAFNAQCKIERLPGWQEIT